MATTPPPPQPHYLGGTTAQAASRLLVSFMFIVSAASKVQFFDQKTGGPAMIWFGPKIDQFTRGLQDMIKMNVSLDKAIYPQILLAFAFSEFLGALLFAFDQRFGAQLLVMITVTSSMVFHNFWDFLDQPVIMHNEVSHFLKNIAILGGLLYYLCTSPGTRHRNKYDQMIHDMRSANAAAMARRQQAGPSQPTVEEKKDQ